MSDSITDRKLADLASDAAGLQEKAEAWFLGQGPVIAPELISALDDDEWGSTGHWRIMRLLARMRIRDSVPALLGRLEAGRERRDATLIQGAMEALSAFDEPEAEAALVDVLNSPNRDHAIHAAILLEVRRAPRLIGQFAALLERDDASMQHIALRALRSIQDPRAEEIVNRHEHKEDKGEK